MISVQPQILQKIILQAGAPIVRVVAPTAPVIPSALGMKDAETRAILADAETDGPVYLTEAGREGVFVFNAGDRSADVADDPLQGLFVAPTTDPTGASGAWVRRGFAAKTPTMFGATGNGVTDDYAALQAWLDSGGDLFLPEGQFYSSQTLVIRNHVRLRGVGYGFDARVGGGYAAMPGSRIRFPAGVAGFDVQPQTTITDVATVLADITAAFTQEGSAHSTFADFALIGGGGAAATGFYDRTIVHARNVHVVQFSGKGFDVSATSDTPDGNDYGNASNATFRDCVALQNGSHGFHMRGRDANTIELENCNAHENGGWGFLEEGFLGNTYLKPHIAANTLGAIKSVEGVNYSRWDTPYIEGDVFSNCEISGTNIIIGADLTAINTPPDAPPSMYGSNLTTVRRMKFVWGAETDFAYPIASMCLVYRDSNLGLVLAGQGSGADIAFKNKNGDTVLNVATGTQWVSFKGDISLDGVNPIARLGGTGGTGPQFLMANGGTDKLQVYASAGAVYVSADTLILRDKTTLAPIAVVDPDGIDLSPGKSFMIDGVPVGAFATVEEVNAGLVGEKSISPDVLSASNYGTDPILLQVSDPAGAAITVGDGKAYYMVPKTLNGWKLVDVAMGFTTSSSSGIPTVQIANETAAVDMLSTALTVDVGDKHSKDATTPAAINALNNTVSTGDMLRVDNDVAGTGAKGQMVELHFARTD